ncbi:MAG: SIR2 family protein [bacterium]|jgi:hypothetical protein
MIENPDQQAAEIIDCLTQTDRPIGLLIGAGCPCSIMTAEGKPLIPDISGLTDVVIKVLERDLRDKWGIFKRQLEEDDITTPNVEQLLSRVRGMRAYAGSGVIRGLTGNDLKTMESKICKEIVSVANVSLPNNANPYQQMAVWIKSAGRSTPVEIFTTNYDLLVEQALERHHAPFFDGFVGSCKPFFDGQIVDGDHIPKSWARLWKIHGSINWRRDESGERLNIWRGEPGDGELIHPSDLKYDESRKMPYLAMMDRLKIFMRNPSSVLITSGFSFSDQHLNEMIVQGLRANSSSVAFGLLYGKIDKYDNAIKLAKLYPNFRIHADDGSIIGTQKITWIEQENQPCQQLPDNVVQWTQKDEASKWNARFLLGDFAKLGNLLEYISRNRYRKEQADAERS